MGYVEGYSNATCFNSSLPVCGNSNWGWSNKLSGATTGLDDANIPKYPIIAGGGKDCKGRTTVGYVPIRCEPGTDPDQSTVTFGPLDQAIIGTDPVNHLSLGCGPNTACTPPAFYATKISACNQKIALEKCGGTITTIPMTAKLNCTCGNVTWVFHQSASPFTVEPGSPGCTL
jgi:hypothetical protein